MSERREGAASAAEPRRIPDAATLAVMSEQNITFCGPQGRVVSIGLRDGKVTLYAEPDAAALAFWNAVEQLRGKGVVLPPAAPETPASVEGQRGEGRTDEALLDEAIRQV